MRFLLAFLITSTVAMAEIIDKDITLPVPEQDYFNNNEVIDDRVLKYPRMLDLRYAFSHPDFIYIQPNFEYSKVDILNVEANKSLDTFFRNAAFNGKSNQVMIYGGISIRHGKLERYMGGDGKYNYNLGFGGISYGQETSFFKIPARLNVELSFFKGRENGMVNNTPKDYTRYDQISLGVSQDLIFGWKYFYFAPGLGIYMKDQNNRDDRISSRLHFGVRTAVGSNIGCFNIELFLRHFSNGSITDNNSGQNFVGTSIGFRF